MGWFELKAGQARTQIGTNFGRNHASYIEIRRCDGAYYSRHGKVGVIQEALINMMSSLGARGRGAGEM